MRARVVRARVDEHRLDRRLGKTALERELHDLRAVALAEISFASDPEVDRALVWRDLSPIARLLARRVDDLHEADRPAVELGDELLAPVRRARELGLPAPVAVGLRGDEVRLAIPASQQLQVPRAGPPHAQAASRHAAHQARKPASITASTR